jgi:hypothetical protein
MSTTTSPILFEAAENYANETSDVSTRPDLRMAFVTGAEWQWNRDAEINDLTKNVEFWKAHSLANAELVDLERGRREAKDAEIARLREALETIRAIGQGASAAGKPEMGLQTIFDQINVILDPVVVEEVSDATV